MQGYAIGQERAAAARAQMYMACPADTVCQDALIDILYLDALASRTRRSAAAIARRVGETGLVCRYWQLCAAHEHLWLRLVVRVGPAVPILLDCSPAAPITPLTTRTKLPKLPSARRFYRQRTLVGATAAKSFCATLDDDGQPLLDLLWEHPLEDIPRCICTADGLHSFGLSDMCHFGLGDLTYVFELFELESASQLRGATDYVSRAPWAAGPHFSSQAPSAFTPAENLIWSACVRGESGSLFVSAVAPTVPCEAIKEVDGGWTTLRTSGKKIAVGTTVPLDSYDNTTPSGWLKSYRLVVTARRDHDGKMAQLIDVRGDKNPFTEAVGDSCCGERLVTVVDAGILPWVSEDLVANVWLGTQKALDNTPFLYDYADVAEVRTDLSGHGSYWDARDESRRRLREPEKRAGAHVVLTRAAFCYRSAHEDCPAGAYGDGGFDWQWDQDSPRPEFENEEDEPPEPYKIIPDNHRYKPKAPDVSTSCVELMLAGLRWQ